MSILIKGMKMPKSCVECHWYYECYDEHCTLGKFILRKYTTDASEEPYILDVQRHPDCPLIDIVQCNDCKYGHKHILKDTYDCYKSDITVFHEADFFCKASERRE